MFPRPLPGGEWLSCPGDMAKRLAFRAGTGPTQPGWFKSHERERASTGLGEMVVRAVKRMGNRRRAKRHRRKLPGRVPLRSRCSRRQTLPMGVLPSETGRQVVPVVDESTGASAASRGAELAIAPWGVVSAMDLSKVPDADSTLPAAEVQQLVKRIAAHVLKALPEFFAAHKEVLAAADVFEAADVLEQKKPQEYQALRLLVAGKGGMVSYKAPWNADNAKMSLQRNGMYEASANLFWLNPFPQNKMAQQIAGDQPQ